MTTHRLLSGLFAATALALTTFASTASAQALADPSSAPNPNVRPTRPQLSPEQASRPTIVNSQARIQLDGTLHNFGEIWDSKPVEHIFTFTNIGSETLRLWNEKGSCGCTVPEVVPREVAPGEQGTIRVRFNPAGRQGPQRGKRVTADTNDPTQPRITLNIHADVIQIVLTEPRLVNIGSVDVNEEGSRRVTFYGRSNDFEISPAKPVEGAARSPFIIQPVKVDEPVSDKLIAQGYVKRFDFDIIIPPGSRVDNYNFPIPFQTNDERARRVDVLTRAIVVGDLSLDPSRMMLGNIVSGEPMTRSFRVISKTGTPFNVTGYKIEGVLERATVGFTPADPEKRDLWNVTVSATPEPKVPSIRGELILLTDRASEPELPVRYFGYMRPARVQPTPTATPATPAAGGAQ